MSFAINILNKAIYYQLNGLCGGRVYPSVASQKATTPYIVYSITASDPDHTKDRSSVADKVTVQVDIFDKKVDVCHANASLVREQLDFIKDTIAGVPIDTSRYINEFQDFIPDVRLHTVSQDYVFRLPNDTTSVERRGDNVIKTFTEITGDSSQSIAAGYDIIEIICENSTNNLGQISCGFTSGGNEVFSQKAINPNGFTKIPVFADIDLDSAPTLYFNAGQDGDDWNGVELTIYVLLTKIK